MSASKQMRRIEKSINEMKVSKSTRTLLHSYVLTAYMDGYLEGRKSVKDEQRIMNSVDEFIAGDIKKETSNEVSS